MNHFRYTFYSLIPLYGSLFTFIFRTISGNPFSIFSPIWVIITQIQKFYAYFHSCNFQGNFPISFSVHVFCTFPLLTAFNFWIFYLFLYFYRVISDSNVISFKGREAWYFWTMGFSWINRHWGMIKVSIFIFGDFKELLANSILLAAYL